MIINFIAQRRDDPYIATVEGDTIWIDGAEFDFSPLPDGSILPAEAVDCKYFVDKITRQNGVIEITLFQPHGANAPAEARVNRKVDVDVGDVPFPVFDIKPEEPDYGDVVLDPEPEPEVIDEEEEPTP